MPKRTQKAPVTASTDPNVKSNTFICRDFTTKNGKKLKLQIQSNQTFKSIKTQLEEEFGIEFEFNLYYDRHELSNTQQLFELLEIANEAGREDEELIVRRKIKLNNIRSLKTELVLPDDSKFPYGVVLVDDEDPVHVRKRIKDVVIDFVDNALKDPTKASFQIPSRSAENIGYDEELKMVLMGNLLTDKAFRNLSSVQSFSQFSEMMKLVDAVLRERIHATKRDLFYRNPKLFGDQRVSDGLIEDLGAMLRVTRNSLNVIASAKGKVLGRLQFTEGRDRIDCSQGLGGRAITPMTDQITNLESDAEFVLVIEKDAAFQRLAEDRFFDFMPCILVTASGQPDIATRLFVKKIREELDIPVLGFMDADPYGFEILRVYTIGSKAKSLETYELAVTDIKWLGLLPTDLDKYNIPTSARIPMTKEDTKRAEDLLEEDFVRARPEWLREVEIMINTQEKAEIQALMSHELRYMTNVYLPQKLESGDWL